MAFLRCQNLGLFVTKLVSSTAAVVLESLDFAELELPMVEAFAVDSSSWIEVLGLWVKHLELAIIHEINVQRSSGNRMSYSMLVLEVVILLY